MPDLVIAALVLDIVGAILALLMAWGVFDDEPPGPESKRRAARITLTLPLWFPFVGPGMLAVSTYLGLRHLWRAATWKPDPSPPGAEHRKGPIDDNPCSH